MHENKEEEKKLINRVTVNLDNTGYSSVERCVRNLGFKITTSTESNMLFWCDTNVGVEYCLHLRPWQFVNHFPGTIAITKKVDLSRNFQRMRRQFPKLYNFHPKSYILPTQALDLKQKFQKSNKLLTFIIKPDLGAQGRGITLIQDAWSVDDCKEPAIAQEYISPFLVDGLKFDLRIYVLVTSVNPIRLYVFKEGLSRFCTEPYEQPSSDNLTDIFRHLTNYSVNKHNEQFKQNTKPADGTAHSHKRSMTAIFHEVAKRGGDPDNLQFEIDKMIVLTLMAASSVMQHNYRTAFKQDDGKSRCFEILGFDVLIDEEFKPWLLEVNHSPSFSCDSPFDQDVKDRVISGALRIMNFDPHFIGKIQQREKSRTQDRISGRTPRPIQNIFQPAIESRIAKMQTDWRQIYPTEDPVLTAIYERVSTSNTNTPMAGVDETAATRHRREAIQNQIHALESARKAPPTYKKKIVASSRCKKSSTPIDPSRPTKSVILLREAQKSKLQKINEKEPIFLNATISETQSGIIIRPQFKTDRTIHTSTISRKITKPQNVCK